MEGLSGLASCNFVVYVRKGGGYKLEKDEMAPPPVALQAG